MTKKQPKIFKLSDSKKKTEKNSFQDFSKMLDEINEIIDYLPSDSILLIPFLDPLIKAAGLSHKRFENIIMSGSPNEEDKELLQWAAELGFLMLDIVMEKDKKEKELLREEVVEVAADFVPRVKSRKILPDVEAVFEELKKRGNLDADSGKLVN